MNDVKKLILDDNSKSVLRDFEDSVKRYDEDRAISHKLSIEMMPELLRIFKKNPLVKDTDLLTK